MNKPTPTSQSAVTLREITKDTFHIFCDLSVAAHQKTFVAPNAYSLAEALFNQERAWFRGIYADETPIGFLMLDDQPHLPEYYLWRLMIDIRYQGNGFGKRAVDLVIEHVKSRPRATELLTSIEPGGPQGFYEKLGFALTGEFDDEEAMMSLKL